MKKIKIGDLFEIDTPRGKGYFQYVYNDKVIGELIRVLPGLHVDCTKDVVSLVVSKEIYFVHFPLKAAYKRGIVKLIEIMSCQWTWNYQNKCDREWQIKTAIYFIGT